MSTRIWFAAGMETAALRDRSAANRIAFRDTQIMTLLLYREQKSGPDCTGHCATRSSLSACLTLDLWPTLDQQWPWMKLDA